ncbi:hypothetical protein EDC96DRAFT_528424 [Choanephora cucurbitarum]|nr:hypothetical protein EDC96DRAFT_528424 [Choanephora cucurbitarum]
MYSLVLSSEVAVVILNISLILQPVYICVCISSKVYFYAQNPKTKDSDNFIYLCMLKLFILIRVGLKLAVFSTFLRDDDKHMRQTRSGK